MTKAEEKNSLAIKKIFEELRQESKTIRYRHEIFNMKVRKAEDLMEIAGIKTGIMERGRERRHSERREGERRDAKIQP